MKFLWVDMHTLQRRERRWGLMWLNEIQLISSILWVLHGLKFNELFKVNFTQCDFISRLLCCFLWQSIFFLFQFHTITFSSICTFPFPISHLLCFPSIIIHSWTTAYAWQFICYNDIHRGRVAAHVVRGLPWGQELCNEVCHCQANFSLSSTQNCKPSVRRAWIQFEYGKSCIE